MKTIALMLCLVVLTGCCTASNNYCQPIVKSQAEPDYSVEYFKKQFAEQNGETSMKQTPQQEAAATQPVQEQAPQKYTAETTPVWHEDPEKANKKANTEFINSTLNKGRNTKRDTKVMAFENMGYMIVLYKNEPCNLGTVESPLMLKALTFNHGLLSHGCWGVTLDEQIKLIDVWDLRNFAPQTRPEVIISIHPQYQFKPAKITKDGFVFD